MENPLQFAREVQQEMNKVSWPTRRETVTSTIMVLVLVLISAAFFYLVDSVISAAVRIILGLAA